MYTQINNKYRLYMSNWLLFMFFLVSSMIVVGGLTRLTDSGLSITEWEFFRGFLPPLTNETWNEYFNSLANINRQGARYICDKMPHNFLLIDLIRFVLPEAKIIYCKRKPKDNCFSLLTHLN